MTFEAKVLIPLPGYPDQIQTLKIEATNLAAARAYFMTFGKIVAGPWTV